MIFFGVCSWCGFPILVPAFSVEPVNAECPCQKRDEVIDAVARGHRFDARIQQLHTLFLSDLSGATLESLAVQMAENIQSLCDGIEQRDSKMSMAFLIRIAALIRYAAVDCPELKEASSAL